MKKRKKFEEKAPTMDEVGDGKKKGAKRRKSTAMEIKAKKQKSQNEESSMDNLSVKGTIEKDNNCHGFPILGGETKQFMHLASQRGKCDKLCRDYNKEELSNLKRNHKCIFLKDRVNG